MESYRVTPMNDVPFNVFAARERNAETGPANWATEQQNQTLIYDVAMPNWGLCVFGIRRCGFL